MRGLTISDPALVGVRRTTYLEAVLADSSPAGIWLLNDSDLSGTNRWQDSSGASRHAADLGDTLNPAPTTSSLHGGLTSVAAFDGSNDRVQVPHASTFNAASMSVEAWVKVAASASFWTIAARCATAFANSGSAFYTRVTTTQVQFARFSGSNLTTYSINASVMDDAWHHIVWVYTSSTFQVFVDGSSAGSVSTSGVLNQPTIDLYIGVDVSSAPTNFKAGQLAGVAIHPGASLTGAQAAAHYAAAA